MTTTTAELSYPNVYRAKNGWWAQHPSTATDRYLGRFDSPEQARRAVLHAQADWYETRAADYRAQADKVDATATDAGTRPDGYTGVYRAGRRWWAMHLCAHQDRYLGTFDTPHEARAAVLDAAARWYENRATRLRTEAALLPDSAVIDS